MDVTGVLISKYGQQAHTVVTGALFLRIQGYKKELHISIGRLILGAMIICKSKSFCFFCQSQLNVEYFLPHID